MQLASIYFLITVNSKEYTVHESHTQRRALSRGYTGYGLACRTHHTTGKRPVYTYRLPVSLFVSVTVNVYHCVNGDRLFDGQIGLGTHSACQCKFDGDGDGNRGGTCKWTLIGKH